MTAVGRVGFPFLAASAGGGRTCGGERAVGDMDAGVGRGAPRWSGGLLGAVVPEEIQ